MNTELLAVLDSYKNLFHLTSPLGATLVQGSSPQDLRSLAGKFAGIVSRTPTSDPTPLIFLADVFVAFGEPRRGELSTYANSANVRRNQFKQIITVCTRIPQAIRRPALTWLHHLEAGLASAELTQISTWLDTAERNGLNVVQLRNHIRQDRSIKPSSGIPIDSAASVGPCKATTDQCYDEKFTKSMRVLVELRLLTGAVTSNQNVWRSWNADQRKRAAQTVVPLIEFVEMMHAALLDTPDAA